jgi:hypothetical protein
MQPKPSVYLHLEEQGQDEISVSHDLAGVFDLHETE